MKKPYAVLLVLLLLCCRIGAQAQTAAEAPDPERLLTVTVNGADCLLGVHTVEDLAARGWPYEVEADGVFGFRTESESYFYVRTAGGAPADPIVSIDLMWADGVPAVYCGFEADQDVSADGVSLWQWLIDTFQAEMNEDGTLVARYPLADGQTLKIETKDTRVRLTLLPPAQE